MKLVRLPAGSYVMGLPDTFREHDPLPGYDPHIVRITEPFSIGMYEVTQEQYRRLVKDKAGAQAGASATSAPGLPVTDINWHAASEFCRLLSVLPAERAANRRYRVPTEAEWEYACRAGSRAPFTGAKPKEGAERAKHEAIHPVGSYPPNAFGLYDMRENAWEWCADWSDESYYRHSPTVNPRGPKSGVLRVVRGRDWAFTGFEYCFLTRDPMPPLRTSPLVGFRVVCQEHEGTPAQ